VNGFAGRQAHAESKNSAISLSNGSGVTIRNSRAAQGTQTFLTHTGIRGGILLFDNDFSRAEVVISPAKVELTQSGNVMPSGRARD